MLKTLRSLFLSAVILGAPALAGDAKGFIYGTIETDSGNTYTGTLRWGNEEAFWDDLFHADKDHLPFLRRAERDKKRRIRVLGIDIGYKWDSPSSSRILVARFGDISEIKVGGGDHAELLMKNGSVFEVDGGSNDVGADIHVEDESLGAIDVSWKKIERIRFRAAPRDLKVSQDRLYGVVEAGGETFEGFVQWDKQECLSGDKLDGETRDGELSIDMGKIRTIERRSSSSSRVVLWDDRELVLRGTNDVDDRNRGIYVEDARFGRVEIPWDAFESVTFVRGKGTGRGYEDYKPARHLRGTVTSIEGERVTGDIIFDLDESETWEMLHGSWDEIEYNIPFELVRSIEPGRWDSSEVVLLGGHTVRLEDGQDVSERNDGVLVLEGDGDEDTYVRWRDVKRIEFK